MAKQVAERTKTLNTMLGMRNGMTEKQRKALLPFNKDVFAVSIHDYEHIEELKTKILALL